MFHQRGSQSRFANARLTGKQHHLPFAGLCLRPSAQQQFEFFLASDKLGQAGRVKSVEAALDRGWSRRGPGSNRL
jgi:hypothetical protein